MTVREGRHDGPGTGLGRGLVIDMGGVRGLGVGDWRKSQMWDWIGSPRCGDLDGQKVFHSKQAGCICREVPWLRNGSWERVRTYQHLEYRCP